MGQSDSSCSVCFIHSEGAVMSGNEQLMTITIGSFTFIVHRENANVIGIVAS